MNNNLFTAASFLVTEDCNLRCTYCFEKHNKKKMTKEVAKAMLDYLCNNAINLKKQEFSVMIFGGEPLLNPNIVEYILDYGTELFNKTGVQFSASMVTNATIMTDRIEKMITKYKNILSVQLSIDGTPEVQNMFRVTKANNGSWDLVEKTLPIWKRIYKDLPRSLSVHGCSNSKTLPYLFESFKFFNEEIGIKNLWYMPIHSETWSMEDVKLYEEQLMAIANYLLEEFKLSGGDKQVIMNYAPIDRCEVRRFSSAPCGAGKTFCTVSADGDLYPCHQFYFNDLDHSSKFGNILDMDSINENRISIFKNYDRTDMSCSVKDPNCDAHACYICIGDNYTINGSILSTVDLCGPRCLMSKVEKKIQNYVNIEMEKIMSLMKKENINSDTRIGNNPNNPACLCDSRGGADDRRIEDNHVCKCGNDGSCRNMNEAMLDDTDDVLAAGLTYAINKIEELEATLKLMNAQQELIIAHLYKK